MKNTVYFIILSYLLVSVNVAFGQDVVADRSVRAENTMAYKLVDEKEVEVNTELKNLLENYTESFPAVRSKQFELEITRIEKAKLLLVKSNKFNLLNDNYGNLILRKITLEVEIRDLLADYTPQHRKVLLKLPSLIWIEKKMLEYNF